MSHRESILGGDFSLILKRNGLNFEYCIVRTLKNLAKISDPRKSFGTAEKIEHKQGPLSKNATETDVRSASEKWMRNPTFLTLLNKSHARIM